jgi:hypothetical protein
VTTATSPFFRTYCATAFPKPEDAPVTRGANQWINYVCVT